MMNLQLDSLIMLLFCCQLEAYKEVPVTPEEWLVIEKIIKMHGLKGPTSLLGMKYEELIDVLGIDEFCAYKMHQRMKTMDIFIKALSDIENRDIQVITKYDEAYPKVLLRTMKKRAPLYLFYSGDITLVKEGISLAGLVEVTKKERGYTKRLVDKIKEEQFVLVSNDTRGIDDVALQYALHHDCVVACFICHDFYKKQQEYRRYLKSKQMILLTAVDPAKYFTVTNAIDRNSYVCGLSKYQIIISSKINNGATWFTALQNMHQRWTIPFVVENDTIGNIRLLDMGAVSLTIKDILSEHSFDMMYHRNKEIIEESLVHMDQMSIFEFIGDDNENTI
jgi:predicted Rossmann fold nucleotide-binding protein DprA/Smf involved in DNA uptake